MRHRSDGGKKVRSLFEGIKVNELNGTRNVAMQLEIRLKLKYNLEEKSLE